MRFGGALFVDARPDGSRLHGVSVGSDGEGRFGDPGAGFSLVGAVGLGARGWMQGFLHAGQVLRRRDLEPVLKIGGFTVTALGPFVFFPVHQSGGCQVCFILEDGARIDRVLILILVVVVVDADILAQAIGALAFLTLSVPIRQPVLRPSAKLIIHVQDPLHEQSDIAMSLVMQLVALAASINL